MRDRPTRWPFFVALVVGVSAVAVTWYLLLSDRPGEAVPASGGHYTEGVTRAADRMNPLFAGPNQTDADVASLVFSGLVRLSPDGTPQPDLAERWEITGNGQDYLFHLRHGIAWQDGEPFSSDDVAFTFRAIADPNFKGGPALAQLMQGVVVTARDPLTVEFRLEQAYAPFLSYMAVGILPHHLLDGLDANQLFNAPFNARPVGTGPYAFSSSASDRVVLKSNPTYYLGPPKISAFELRVFPDRASLLGEIRDGAVDGALLDPGTSQAELDVLRQNRQLSTHRLVGTAFVVVYLDTRGALFGDPVVRSALRRAIDVSGLISLSGPGGGAASPAGIVPGSWAYAKPDAPDFDPGAAASALERAGWSRRSDGFRHNGDHALAFTLSTPNDAPSVAVAQELARDWQAVGADVKVQPLDESTFVTGTLLKRSFEAALATDDAGADGDPYPFWHTSQLTPPGRNVSGYGDPRVDDVLERARQTTETQRRQDLYTLFQAYFIDDIPAIPLFAPGSTYVQSTRVQGFKGSLLFTPASRFGNVADWYVETSVR